MSFSLRLAVVVMMLITALGLGFISMQLVQPKATAVVETQAPSAPAPLEISILVAAHPLPAGTLAVDSDFAAKMIPATQVPPEVLPDTPENRASIHGALVRSYVDGGTMLTNDMLLRPRERGFLATVLDQGTRAVSVGVDPVSGVSGLIWPGDRVDVLLTQQFESAPVAERVISETIMTGVRVIGIDQDIAQGGASSASVAGKLARTVTLQVDREQAEKLAVAQQLGKILLSIRSASDELLPGRGARATTAGSDVSAALARTGPEPVGTTIGIVEGGKRREVTFK